MQHWLIERAQTTPDAPALVTGDETWTYKTLNHQVRLGAGRLHRQGIGKGHRVAVLMAAGQDYVTLIHAIMRLGAALVPLNTRLTPEEIDRQLAVIQPTALVHDAAFAATAAALTTDCWVLPFERAEPRATLPDIDPAPLDLEAPCAIIHTSGTGGSPRGVVLTYGSLFYSAMASACRIGHLPGDRWLSVLPLFHVGGLSIHIRATLYGITVVQHPAFDVAAVNHALTHDDITLVSLVPTMLRRLLDARDEPWSGKLRLVLLGGAAAPADLLERCIEAAIPIATTYGLTEAASQVATTLPGDAARKPGTVGKPLLFTRVRILGEDGRPARAGTSGEILVKGPTVMREYANRPDDTAHALKNGWLHTGDIGKLDDDGDLYVFARRSNRIVSGGENIAPREVEDVLRGHPAVKNACVVGLEDADLGQRVAAAVVLHEGETLSADDLIAYSRQHLAGYKIPRRVRFLDHLPQTASGKIQHAAVIDLFAEP